MNRKLSKRQREVLDSLFGGSETVEQVLERHEVSAELFADWQGQKDFAEQVEARILRLGLESRLLIARYAAVAAARLVSLTESGNQETARKACLDIIDRIQKTEHTIQNEETLVEQEEQSPGVDAITPDVAQKLLSVLAGENRFAFIAQSRNISTQN
jgi:hypothetical protein